MTLERKDRATGGMMPTEDTRDPNADLKTQLNGLLNTRIDGVENPETDPFFLRNGEDATQVIKMAGKLGVDVSDKAHKVLDELLGSEEIARLLALRNAKREISYKGQKVELECDTTSDNNLIVDVTFSGDDSEKSFAITYDIATNAFDVINQPNFDMPKFRDFLKSWEPIEEGMDSLRGGKDVDHFLHLVGTIMEAPEENYISTLRLEFDERKYRVQCELGKPSGYNIKAMPVAEKGKELQSAEPFEFTIDEGYKITSSNISYSRVKAFIDGWKKA